MYANRDEFLHQSPHQPREYHGCTAAAPRRGVVRTRPWALLLAERSTCTQRGSTGPAALAAAEPAPEPAPVPAAARPPAIVLELEDRVWAGVPCWTGRAERWARWVVPIAYDLRYNVAVRPLMGANQVGRETLVAIAAARARYADHSTGRNCRPSNTTLAALAQCDERTVRRASRALRLLGVATEVLRGRQRTRMERLASWRVGDRGRGWASVWALHDDAALARAVGDLSPHPAGSFSRSKTSSFQSLTTASRRPAGTGNSGARRRAGPDSRGRRLAMAWRADRDAPPWAQRHSAAAWAAVLAGPAAAGWVPRDVTALLADWAGVRGWLPDSPHRPIGLLGAALAWHGDLAVRPAAIEMAREAAELAAARARVAAQLAARDQAAAARAVGRAALTGPGRALARQLAAEATARALARRTGEVAAEVAAHDAAVRDARGLPGAARQDREN